MAPQLVAETTRKDLASAYERTNGPFIIEGSAGQPDFVVMSASDFQDYDMNHSEAEYRLVCEDYLATREQGAGTESGALISHMREKYGL